MTAYRHFTLCAAALAAGGLAAGCRTPAPESRTVTAGEPWGEGHPRPGVWIAYQPGGVIATTEPHRDGSALQTVGGLRPPIFSLRLARVELDGALEVEMLTPGGFDDDHIRAGDIRPEESLGDSSSLAVFRETRLENALTHHRPALRLRVERQSGPQVRNAAEIRRFEACARRLLRKAAEGRLASAENETQRERQRERLREDPAARIQPPVDLVALLLRLAMLPLPSGDFEEEPMSPGASPGRPATQLDWRARQIRLHGRPVGLRLDLSSAASAPAANLCRSLAFRNISAPSKDSCTISGVIDRRDGWPIVLAVSRKGESASGATENQSRSFSRITPLQGFEAPSNPCPAGR